jgi:MtrB/PioB family decaheme-associated outer membrane protein
VGLGALLLLALAAPALAEQGPGAVVISGQAQVGGRGVIGDPDSAKFQEYRDIREDAIGALRFLLEDSEGRYYLWGRADDIGDRDQEYEFEGGRYGQWGMRGGYSEIPHVFSRHAVSPYVNLAGNVLTLPPGFDRGLDPSDPGGFVDYVDQLLVFSQPTTLSFRTIQGYGEIFAKPTTELDFDAGYRIIDKDGTRPLSMGFGSPGGSFVNFAGPIKERIHEATANAQYVRESWNLGLNYTGSFFENDYDAVSIANPLQEPLGGPPATDPSDVGRLSLAPDNSAHLVTLSGSGLLPVGFPARLAASFSWGVHIQKDDFIPFTSNTSLPGSDENAACDPPCLTLPQNDLDGWVQTMAGNLVFTARPMPSWNIKARYRIYDYDNQTDPVLFTSEVINDRSIQAINRRTVANSYRRQNAVVESSHALARSVSGTLGFEYEHWNRSRDREVHNQSSYGPTARIDWRPSGWSHLRGSYAFVARRGTGYDWLAPFSQQLPPAEVPGFAAGANLPGLRKFSQANYLQHRFGLLTQLTPHESFDFSFSTGFKLTDYDDSSLGLTDDNRFNAGVEVSYRPHPRVGLSAFYAFDYIWAYQKQVNRPFGFPTPPPPAPWEGTTFDVAHNGGAAVDAVLWRDFLDARLSYFIQYGNAKTTGVGAASAWPALEDTLQAVDLTFDVYPLTRTSNEFARGISFQPRYRFEKYDRSFFTENFPVSDDDGDIFLQDGISDYDAHIFTLMAIIEF